jgi:hypothetical protein
MGGVCGKGKVQIGLAAALRLLEHRERSPVMLGATPLASSGNGSGTYCPYKLP